MKYLLDFFLKNLFIFCSETKLESLKTSENKQMCKQKKFHFEKNTEKKFFCVFCVMCFNLVSGDFVLLNWKKLLGIVFFRGLWQWYYVILFSTKIHSEKQSGNTQTKPEEKPKSSKESK